MKLVWKPAARLDRYAIFDFIESDDAQAAINLDELFEARSNILRDTPHMGRVGRVKGTRELVVHRTI